ncbi:shematrin-like protein 2 [Haliotis rubra]|uniref:shematrin-like protein 2 n=1 Tax=Haliotis rubra TaxID=36100 RepID=UPI001EE5D8B0|nr:shematrin-like protein 2 [Haliotis rubra]
MAMLHLVLVAALAHLTSGQGWGAGRLSPGRGAVAPGIGGAGLGIGGVGPGIGGAGSGFGGTVSGFGGVGTGIGSAGLGIGRTSSFGLGASLFGLINPYYNTTITCSGTVPGFAFAVTLKRAPPVFGAWWAQRQGGLSGSVVLRTTSATGNFQFVLTERARTEGGCTPDGLGNVFGSNALGLGLGQVFGQQWGRGFGKPWGQIFGTGRVTRPGVVADVTIANGGRTLDVASLNLPFRDLERYAGRAFAFCPSLTTGVDGRQVCMGPILACCKLGYNNQDAVVPTPL